MSTHAFIGELLLLSGLLALAIFSGPLSAAAARFFYGTANRRRK